MKKKQQIKTFWIMALVTAIILLITGCNKTIYVPVESVRTEYKDRLLKDSVHLYDSIFVKIANDTVWLEKYKYTYRDKIVRDSIFINDTIRIPYPVIEYKEVNKLKNWQNFLIWAGVISVIIMLFKRSNLSTFFKL